MTVTRTVMHTMIMHLWNPGFGSLFLYSWLPYFIRILFWEEASFYKYDFLTSSEFVVRIHKYTLIQSSCECGVLRLYCLISYLLWILFYDPRNARTHHTWRLRACKYAYTPQWAVQEEKCCVMCAYRLTQKNCYFAGRKKYPMWPASIQYNIILCVHSRLPGQTYGKYDFYMGTPKAT